MENKLQAPAQHQREHIHQQQAASRTWWPGRLRRPEVSVMLALLAISLSIWGFIELADAVDEGYTRSFDESLLLALRTPGDLSDPIGPGWAEEVGRDFTALGGMGVLTVLTLGVIGYLLLEGKRRLALVVVLASVGALSLSTGLKHSIDRSRPDLVPHGSIVYTKSFPSGHSMQAAATYLTLAALLAGVQRRRRNKTYLVAIAVFITVLVGVSRVYMGVHWPTDVLAGWTAGAAWALLCWLVARFLRSTGQVEAEEELID
jgi:undecaprenyl-diphosphatase